MSQPLPAYRSAILNGSAGGSNVSVNLWAFDLAVDPTMAFGPATLSAVGGSACSELTEIFYDRSADLRIVDSGGVQVPEPGTLALLGLGLAGLGLS